MEPQAIVPLSIRKSILKLNKGLIGGFQICLIKF